MTRYFSSIVVAVALSAVVTAQDQVYKPGGGVTLPAVVKEVKPVYTKAARDAGIQGAVSLKVLVKDDGTVGNVQVTQSLDKEHGLDNQAVQAAKQWEFRPGTKDTKPVAVEIALEMTFTLK